MASRLGSLHAEIFEPALHRHHFHRRLRPHVAIGMQPQLADAGLVDAADAGNEREPLGEPRPVGLDVDHDSRRRAPRGRDRPTVPISAMRPPENSATRSHTLCTRSSRCEDRSTDTPSLLKPRMMVKQLRRGVRIEPRRRLVEDGDLRALHQNLGKPEALPHAAENVATRLSADSERPTRRSASAMRFSRSACSNADQARGVAQIVGRRELS